MTASYALAMSRAEERFAPLAAALTRELGLDVDPVVDQTGGMVMCLGIYWPDDAYVWFSDYWWFQEDLILGLYEGSDDGDDGTYPAPPAELLDTLVDSLDDDGADGGTQKQADAIAAWAAPLIAAHGGKHGWERRP